MQTTHDSPDQESRWDTLFAVEVHDTLHRFAQSPEHRNAGDGPARHLEAFLRMLARCGDSLVLYDLDDARRLLRHLPHWSAHLTTSDPARLFHELRAFFDFAARTGTSAPPSAWLQLVEQLTSSCSGAQTTYDSRRRPRRNSATAVRSKA